ncbi:hypothetical protein [Clostridium sp.]|uniref:hypothetical protein n=1 Tax=Clostridium sp. TaxID=1506 RepID=UPI003F2E79BB
MVLLEFIQSKNKILKKKIANLETDIYKDNIDFNSLFNKYNEEINWYKRDMIPKIKGVDSEDYLRELEKNYLLNEKYEYLISKLKSLYDVYKG